MASGLGRLPPPRKDPLEVYLQLRSVERDCEHSAEEQREAGVSSGRGRRQLLRW